MKLNIANPATGAQKLLEYDDEKKMRIFYDKQISQEVDAEPLGEEWKGYRFKIMGGNDKQGFPMMQGVLVNHRVRLLLDKNSKCFRPRRPGERKRKSIRGAIAGPDISVLSLIISKKGEGEIPGLTDIQVPRRLGPKRASKIRKLFGLTKKDDVRKYVVRRKLPKKPDGRGKAPKIQRLVTPTVLQRKRRRMALKRRWAEKSRKEAGDYAKLLAQRKKEERVKRLSSKRRSSLKKDGTSEKSSDKGTTAVTAVKGAAKKTEGTTAAKKTTEGTAGKSTGAAKKTTQAASPVGGAKAGAGATKGAGGTKGAGTGGAKGAGTGGAKGAGAGAAKGAGAPASQKERTAPASSAAKGAGWNRRCPLDLIG